MSYLVVLIGIAFQGIVTALVQSKEKEYQYPVWAGGVGIVLYSVYSYFLIDKYSHGVNLYILLILVAVYIAVSLIDFWKYLIPNRLSLLSFLLAVTFLLVNYSHAKVFLLGFGSFLGLFIILYVISAGNFGMGDVKLSASMGMLLGMGSLMDFMLWTFLLAAVVSILLLLFKLKKKEDKIAFGPYMVLSFMLVLLM